MSHKKINKYPSIDKWEQILHEEGPLTGLTPVNVQRAVYTETLITRGAAEQLSILLTHWVELQKPSYIYILTDTFCEGNVSKAQKCFL